MQHIFLNNYQLCSEINETVPQHFIHCVATHGRHVQYLDFLHTIIKAEGKYVKKCQDMIMTEVRTSPVGQELGGSRTRLSEPALLASSLRRAFQPCWILLGTSQPQCCVHLEWPSAISRGSMQGPRASLAAPQFLIVLQMPCFPCKHKSLSPLPGHCCSSPAAEGTPLALEVLTFLFQSGDH